MVDEDDDTILGDLLCDLRHYCHQNGINFEKACLGSEVTFNEELDEEAQEVREEKEDPNANVAESDGV